MIRLMRWDLEGYSKGFSGIPHQIPDINNFHYTHGISVIIRFFDSPKVLCARYSQSGYSDNQIRACQVSILTCLFDQTIAFIKSGERNAIGMMVICGNSVRRERGSELAYQIPEVDL